MSRSSSEEDSSSEEEEVQVESLVSGRERRSNAGNRMSTLLATEESIDVQGDEDDDLKLLFQENGEEEDAEFASGDDAVSDVEMDSSSDEDDGKEDDEEAGEKELERQAREERKRKRKALEIFGAAKRRKTTDVKTASTIKQVKIAVPAEPRPKKKSERSTWLPGQDEGPVRASSRMQTVQNKQIVHERMKETEKRRVKQLKKAEAAAKKKEAEKAEPLTQEDRLAEAAQTEAKNAKTLNRWEAAERTRVAEQGEKLAALKNRGIRGSVVSIWSGPSQWIDGKCVAIGNKMLDDKKRPDGKKGETISGSKSKHGLKNRVSPPLVAPSSAGTPPAITLTSAPHMQSLTGAWDGFAPGNPFYTHSGESHSVLQQTIDSSKTTQNIEIESRVLVHLDSAALKESSMQDSVLIKGRKSSIKIHGKLPEKEKCLITGLHARYRDPKTGIPYANIAAFKQLRVGEASSGYTLGRWSTLLGQYVGSDMDAPNAVPEMLRGNV